MKRWWVRCVPRSLYGRMVVVMVLGTVGAQTITSTVWYDVRHTQSLEIPTRLVATHLADLVRVAEQEPDQVDHLSELLRAPGFEVRVNASATHPDVPLDVDSQAAEDLLRTVLKEKTGKAQTFQLLRLELLDQNDHKAGLPVLLSARADVGPVPGRPAPAGWALAAGRCHRGSGLEPSRHVAIGPGLCGAHLPGAHPVGAVDHAGGGAPGYRAAQTTGRRRPRAGAQPAPAAAVGRGAQ
ncbi:hypothetical protein [Pseudomonas sp. KNUC1026]|uniref:hypothetical protein n=1 Tax=Pseudomonas sp. KNUC1026 TaxID=2893890 RepID=UPI002E3608D8|nr:hypothetical protein [Pseudomonas sp. KNUC1026]